MSIINDLFPNDPKTQGEIRDNYNKGKEIISGNGTGGLEKPININLSGDVMGEIDNIDFTQDFLIPTKLKNLVINRDEKSQTLNDGGDFKVPIFDTDSSGRVNKVTTVTYTLPSKSGGVPGKTSYIHIAYSNSNDGTIGFTLVSTGNETYLGQYTDFSEEGSKDPSMYTWTKIQGPIGPAGEQGKDGADGIPGENGNFTHLAYSDDPTGYKGFSLDGNNFIWNENYNDIPKEVSFSTNGKLDKESAWWTTGSGVVIAKPDFDDMSANVMTINDPGSMAGTPYIEVNEGGNYTLTFEFKMSNMVSDSHIFSVYAFKDVSDLNDFTNLKSKGFLLTESTINNPGSTTVDGENGRIINNISYHTLVNNFIIPADYKYVVIVCDPSSGPSTFSYRNMTLTLKDYEASYIGMYIDLIKLDRPYPEIYTWTRIKGNDGKPGANGSASYLHIAHSNSIDGSVDFSTSDSTGRSYIGTYTDNIKNDSSDPSKYSWFKIEGTDGRDGAPGKAGADGKTTYFHVAYANSADGSLNFSVDDPTNRAYMGTYTDEIKADSTNYTSYAWFKVKGDDGKDGAPGSNGLSSYLHIAYANSADGRTNFDLSDPTNRAYMGTYTDNIQGDSSDPTKYSWFKVQGTDGKDGAPGKAGADGKTTYFHVAYANSPDGSVSFSVDDPTNRDYMGTYTDETKLDSTNYTSYAWFKVKGADGKDGAPGSNGLSSYLHIAYSDSADGSINFDLSDPTNRAYMGTYTDNIQADSSDPTKYAWFKVKGADGKDGAPGKAGADGKTTYFHVAYSNSADGSVNFSVDDPTNRAYMGTYTDTTIADSTNYTSYAWFKVKGADGKDGAPGSNGLSSYLHIAYASSADGRTNFDLSDPTNRAYMGTYTDNIQADSTDPTKYAWFKVQGTDGKDGAPGKAGADGKTTYFHVAYANSADGSVDFNIVDSTNRAYMGTYTDEIQADSTNYTSYAWFKFKGADGKDGAPGSNGASSYLHIAYANSSDGSTGFSISDPTNKTYMGTYTDNIQADSSDRTKYKWFKTAGVNGADGAPGKPGADGKTTYFHVAYANSPDGSVNFSVDDPTNRAYMGTYTDEIQADSTSYTNYAWFRVKGTDGKDGAPGSNGLSSYLHIAYANSADGSTDFNIDDPTNRAYMGTYTDNIQADSTDHTKYTWFKVKGADGTQGVPGPKGADGKTQYTHIAYANIEFLCKERSNFTLSEVSIVRYGSDSRWVYKEFQAGTYTATTTLWGIDPASGTTKNVELIDNFSTSNSTDTTHIGVYVDFAESDSVDPSKYNWTLVKGADGTQGIPGKAGADGKTPYFHTAWSNSSDGTDSFTNVYPNLNLLDNTTFKNYTPITQQYLSLVINDGGVNNKPYVSVSYTNPTTNSFIDKISWTFEKEYFKPSTTYTFSFYIKGSGTLRTNVYPSLIDNSRPNGLADGKVITPAVDGEYDWNLTSEWVRHTYTFITKSSINAKQNFLFRVFTGNSVDICLPKVEEGATATPWMPSASEVTTVDWPSYIGQYTDFTQADSTNSSAYTWSLIRGNDGKDGYPGKPGADGKTTYFHTAYANSSDGNEGFTTIYPNLNLSNNTRLNYDILPTGISNGGGTDKSEKIAVIDLPGFSWGRKYTPSTRTAQSGMRVVTDVSKLKIGDTITNSFWVKNTGNRPIKFVPSIGFRYGTDTEPNEGVSTGWTYTGSEIEVKNDGKWIKMTSTTTIPQPTVASDRTGDILKSVVHYAYSSVTMMPLAVTDTFIISPLKLELGSTATPWMPSASEVTIADWPIYMGTYTDTTIADSTNYADYAWFRVKGVDGKDGAPGEDGNPSYIHTAWAYSADGTDRFTTVYPNLNLGDNTKKFTNAEGGNNLNGSIRIDPLTQKTQDGDFNYLTYKATKDNSDWFRFYLIPEIAATNMTKVTVIPNTKYTFSVLLKGTGQHTIYAYNGWTANNTPWSIQVNLTSEWKLYTFTVTSKDVIPNSGVQFFIRSNNATEISLKKPKVEEGSTATPYMPSSTEVITADYPSYRGDYSDFNQTQSSDPTDYTWVIARGSDGSNGIPGKNGADGKTYYFHIAYANSADGKTNFDVSDPSGRAYMGTYTDLIQSDSTDPTVYTWVKIKGEDGKSPTIIEQVQKWYANQTPTSHPAADDVTWRDISELPTTFDSLQGMYLWYMFKVKYSDGTTNVSFTVTYVGQDGKTNNVTTVKVFVDKPVLTVTTNINGGVIATDPNGKNINGLVNPSDPNSGYIGTDCILWVEDGGNRLTPVSSSNSQGIPELHYVYAKGIETYSVKFDSNGNIISVTGSIWDGTTTTVDNNVPLTTKDPATGETVSIPYSDGQTSAIGVTKDYQTTSKLIGYFAEYSGAINDDGTTFNLDDGDIYTYFKISNTTLIPNATGTTIHTAMSTTSDGMGDFTTGTPDKSKAYGFFGILVDKNTTSSSNYKDYSWINVSGNLPQVYTIGTYSVQVKGDGYIVPGTGTADGSLNQVNYSEISNMSPQTDSFTITYTVTGQDFNNINFTYTLQQSVTKHRTSFGGSTWVVYAKTKDGNDGVTFLPSVDTRFIGVCTSSNDYITAPTDKTLYTWSNYVGAPVVTSDVEPTLPTIGMLWTTESNPPLGRLANTQYIYKGAGSGSSDPWKIYIMSVQNIAAQNMTVNNAFVDSLQSSNFNDGLNGKPTQGIKMDLKNGKLIMYGSQALGKFLSWNDGTLTIAAKNTSNVIQNQITMDAEKLQFWSLDKTDSTLKPTAWITAYTMTIPNETVTNIFTIGSHQFEERYGADGLSLGRTQVTFRTGTINNPYK